jgi:hypothetical protein
LPADGRGRDRGGTRHDHPDRGVYLDSGFGPHVGGCSRVIDYNDPGCHPCSPAPQGNAESWSGDRNTSTDSHHDAIGPRRPANHRIARYYAYNPSSERRHHHQAHCHDDHQTIGHHNDQAGDHVDHICHDDVDDTAHDHHDRGHDHDD